MSDALMRLQVWRRCRSGGQLMSVEPFRPVDRSEMYEEIYACTIVEGLYGALDPEHTRVLHAAIEKFAWEAPDVHEVTGLLYFVGLLDELIGQGCEGQWSDFEDRTGVDSGDPANKRIHGLLAFRARLQWIYDTFAPFSDAIVTIR